MVQGGSVRTLEVRASMREHRIVCLQSGGLVVGSGDPKQTFVTLKLAYI
jgi:hypothetical protein